MKFEHGSKRSKCMKPTHSTHYSSDMLNVQVKCKCTVRSFMTLHMLACEFDGAWKSLNLVFMKEWEPWLGDICRDSQQYIVWVKIIHFYFMPKIIRTLSKDQVSFPTVNISKLNFWLVICSAKDFVWTTVKAIFSIFRFFLHPQILK